LEVKKVSTFQERFSELIESSPKSRTAIAAEFGVAKQTISAWTTGQTSPRLPVISSLADYFGVSSDWLLGFDVPKYSYKPSSEKPPDESVQPHTEESIRIVSGVDKMPPELRTRAEQMLMLAFAEYFKEDPNSDT
jgi:transcriptional regulator with XRE-family HTH domain